MYTIYDVLDAGRIIMAKDEELGFIVTWNKSYTFQIWCQTENRAMWTEVLIRTYPELNDRFQFTEALKICLDLLTEQTEGKS